MEISVTIKMNISFTSWVSQVKIHENCVTVLVRANSRKAQIFIEDVAPAPTMCLLHFFSQYILFTCIFENK